MGALENREENFAPCREACPAGVDVPRYIKFVREGEFGKALAVVRESIPFPAVCGYACVHPCEAKCARAQYDEPVAIRMLKRSAAAYGDALWTEKVQTASPTGKKVAILGAGPCGLTAAYYLAGAGHRVTVFEALPEAGGMMRYGIPEYRLPNQVVDKEISVIKERGVEIRTNTRVDSLDALPAGHDALLVASGAWLGAKIGVEGEAAVLDGISFLRNVNDGKRTAVGGRVVVIGGGNTAVDAARASVRLGARDVVLVYRRTKAEMPADPEEVKDALEEGVRMEFLAAPVKTARGKVTCVRTTLGTRDAGGRPRPVLVEGSEFVIEGDTVIVCVGQLADTAAFGLVANPNGTIVVVDGFAGARKGVFAAGDAVTGPSSIIGAIAQGKEAAASIDKYLGGDGRIGECLVESEAAGFEAVPAGYTRPVTATLTFAERLKTFQLVEEGYSKSTAMKEARRCLSCDVHHYKVEVDFEACKACGYCKEVCSLGIFQKLESLNNRGYQPMEASNNNKCVGCSECFFVCPDFSISIAKVGEIE